MLGSLVIRHGQSPQTGVRHVRILKYIYYFWFVKRIYVVGVTCMLRMYLLPALNKFSIEWRLIPLELRILRRKKLLELFITSHTFLKTFHHLSLLFVMFSFQLTCILVCNIGREIWQVEE